MHCGSRFLHYELLQLQKNIEMPGKGRNKKRISDITWTWRLVQQRYKELEAQVVQVARERDREALATVVHINSSMPLFSGVRWQVIRLNTLAAKLADKFKKGELALPSLPYMVRHKIYDSPSTHLGAWLQQPEDTAND